MHEREALEALSAIAQPMRLKIFRSLLAAGPSGTTPGVLAQTLDAPSPTLSFHLKELVRVGLVTQERVSRNLVYRAAFGRMESLVGFLLQNCCQGEPCLDLRLPVCAHPSTRLSNHDTSVA